MRNATHAEHCAHSAAVRAGRRRCNLLFIGDSLTSGWLHAATGRAAFRRHFSGYSPAAYGVIGDRAAALLARLRAGETDGLSPRLCVLLVGVNDLTPGCNPQVVARIVRECGSELLERHPATAMAVLALPPVYGWGPHMTPSAAAVTEALAEECSGLGPRANLHRAWSGFASNESPARDQFTGDGVHLSAMGYETLAHALAPIVATHLGPPPPPAPLPQGRASLAEYGALLKFKLRGLISSRT